MTVFYPRIIPLFQNAQKSVLYITYSTQKREFLLVLFIMGETLISLIYPIRRAYCLTNNLEMKSIDFFPLTLILTRTYVII